MDEQLVDTIRYEELKAEIYSLNLPGEFKVVYVDANGKVLEEAPLTGISTYRQREEDILKRLRQFSEGARPKRIPDRGDSGEY